MLKYGKWYIYSVSRLFGNSNYFWHLCMQQSKNVTNEKALSCAIIRKRWMTAQCIHTHTHMHKKGALLLNCGIFHKMICNEQTKQVYIVWRIGTHHTPPYSRNAFKCQIHVAITYGFEQPQKYYIQMEKHMHTHTHSNSIRLYKYACIRILYGKSDCKMLP